VAAVFVLAAATAAAASTHTLHGTPARPSTATLPCETRLTTYILAPGDRLTLIARRFGIGRAALRRANPRLRTNEMEVGDVIVLPLPASSSPPPGEIARDVCRGIRGLDRVALTFDAGADLGSLYDLLAVLRARGVRASFFVTGRWAKRYPSALKRIVADGHEVFNHSLTHRSFLDLSDEEIREELERAERIIRRIAGRSPRPYFRPPYGDYDRRVLKAAAAAGWQCVYWTLDSRDAVPPPKTPEAIVERVLSPPRAPDPRRFLDGAVVLFHASKPVTARAMGRIVAGLRAYGLEPSPLTAVLRPSSAVGERPEARGER